MAMGIYPSDIVSHSCAREIKFYLLNYPYRAQVEDFTHTYTRVGKNTRRVTRTRMHTRYKLKEHEYIIELNALQAPELVRVCHVGL
jgi:hypothetical protein